MNATHTAADRLAIRLDAYTGDPMVYVDNDAELRRCEDDYLYYRTGRVNFSVRCICEEGDWYVLRQDFFFDGIGDADEFEARVEALAEVIRRVGSFDPKRWDRVRRAGDLQASWEG